MKNIENIKLLFERFKSSNRYTERESKFEFPKLARSIIIDTLNQGELTNEKLTSFIQMFKANCSVKNFKKYLIDLNLEESSNKTYLKEFRKIGVKGFTLAGKFKISSLNQEQLVKVKNFISSSINVKNKEEALDLVKRFESLNIPEVKAGIYSPWLHYINPDIFPISNSTSVRLFKYTDVSVNKYSDSIQYFHNLRDIIGENFSIIDFFCWNFSVSFVDEYSLSTKIFTMKMPDDKLTEVFNKIINKDLKFSKIIKEEYNFRNGIEEIDEVDYKRYWLLGAFTSLGSGRQEDKTDYMISNSVWINGWENKFLKEVKSIRVGDEVAIKAVFARGDKSLMKIKCKGTVISNPKDGKNLQVEWVKNFEPYELDFTGGYWTTVTVVENEDHIKTIFGNI